MECFFQPQKDKTGPKLTDDEPSLSGATKKKATDKEYEKQTNGFTSYIIYTNILDLCQRIFQKICTIKSKFLYLTVRTV